MEENQKKVLKTYRLIGFGDEDARGSRNRHQSPLLQLPGEIRNMIYDRLFCNSFIYMDPQILRSGQYPDLDDKTKMMADNKAVLAVQLTCLQLHRETTILPVQLGNVIAANSFSALYPPLNIFQSVPLITKLTVQMTDRKDVLTVLPQEFLRIGMFTTVSLERLVTKILPLYPALAHLVIESDVLAFDCLKPQQIMVGKILVETKPFKVSKNSCHRVLG